MRRRVFMAALVLLAVLTLLGLTAIEGRTPRLEAHEGILQLTPEAVGGEPVLVTGWQEVGNGAFAVRVEGNPGSGEVNFYVPQNAGVRLTVGGEAASKWTYGDFGVYTVPSSSVLGEDLGLSLLPGSSPTGANLCLFVGSKSALLSSQQATVLVRLFIAGIDFATALYALSLWSKKRSERYLLPLSLYAFTVMIRILRRSAPFLADNALLGVLFSFPLWKADSMEAVAALNSTWSTFVDLGLRYLVLRAFIPVKLGRESYFVWCAAALGVCAVVETACANPGMLTWLPVLARLGCMALEFAVICRAYLSGRYPDTALLLVAWTLMFSLWAFNRACELGIIPTYAIGAQVGLGGIQETVVLFGLVFSINARFAGKFAQADDLSRELRHVNASLEKTVEEKTRELSSTCESLRRERSQCEEFLSNMAHNIKTPLFSIGGYVDMARALMERDPGEARRCLDIVSKNAARVQEVVQRLLLSFRLESGRVQATVVVQDLFPLASQAVETVAPKATERGVTVRMAHPIGALRCRVDGTLFIEALENILDNAVESSQEGDEVDVLFEADGRATRVAVRDHGSGIRPEALPHVFERYYSGREDDRHGTGIGLSIARGLVEKMGGSVEVQSRWGMGSTFTVTVRSADEEQA